MHANVGEEGEKKRPGGGAAVSLPGYVSGAFWGGEWKKESMRKSGAEAETRDGVTVEQSICMTEPLLRTRRPNISQAAAKTTTFQLHPGFKRWRSCI